MGDRMGQQSLHPSRKHLATGYYAMVACDVPLCSTMGKKILIEGGKAADAAVTVALCIGSVNLHSSGIGGGAYIVSAKGEDYHYRCQRNGSHRCIQDNFRQRALVVSLWRFDCGESWRIGRFIQVVFSSRLRKINIGRLVPACNRVKQKWMESRSNLDQPSD